MIQQKLKTLPVHFLLVPLFFYTHKLNEYFELIPLKHSLELLGYCLLLSIAFFITGKLLFKNNMKAAYWASVLLIIFFFFGFFQDILRSAKPVSFLAAYTVLLPAIVIFAGWLTYATYKRKTLPVKTTLFLNSLFLFFVFAEIGQLAYKKITNAGIKNNLAYQNPDLHINLQAADSIVKPDIFFIVFDEYASSASLKKYLHFDNSKLDTALANNNFYTSRHSKSNYNSTPLSIASSLNLDYFNAPVEGKLTDPKSLAIAQHSFKQSLVPKFLEKEGYKIINQGLIDIDKYPADEESFFSIPFVKNMLSETLWGRVKKEILWHLVVKFPNWKFLSDKSPSIVERNKSNYKALLTQLNMQNDQPKFVLAHFLLPHGDFFLTKEGKPRKITFTDHTILRDSLYLDQLVYANTWIDTISTAANLQFKRPRVIIIEGDHGYREIQLKDKTGYSREKQFMNLNTYYFSDKNYQHLYDSISPVNSFRIVFNKYFNTRLPIIKDSSILLY